MEIKLLIFDLLQITILTNLIWNLGTNSSFPYFQLARNGHGQKYILLSMLIERFHMTLIYLAHFMDTFFELSGLNYQ